MGTHPLTAELRQSGVTIPELLSKNLLTREQLVEAGYSAAEVEAAMPTTPPDPPAARPVETGVSGKGLGAQVGDMGPHSACLAKVPKWQPVLPARVASP